MEQCIFIAAAIPAILAVTSFDVVKEEFIQFKTTHNKTYNDMSVESFRLKNFMENKVYIARHNQRYKRGEVSYGLAMNHFGDLSTDEFKDLMTGYKQLSLLEQLSLIELGTEISLNRNTSTFIPPANVALPAEVDWRKDGAVTSVKCQGECGSCWAFSATGALEGQNFRKTGQLISLSEQNLIDCSSKYGNYGCEGGNVVPAYQYIKNNGGIDTESAYPYDAVDGQCRYQTGGIGATMAEVSRIERGNEAHLQSAVATVGPIAVAIDVNGDFQFYKEGVYFSDSCSSTQLNHAVLAVGYGTTAGKDYWLVKNSWGPSWGDNGYIYMSRNNNNNCGIVTEAVFPLV